MAELVPQPHGGALLKAPPAGAARKGASFKALKRECRELMAGYFIENARTLQKRIEDEDSRVSIIALKEYFDRFLGKTGDTGIAQEAAAGSLDFSHLDEEARARVGEALAVLAFYAKRDDGEEG